jgi:hypothetical protein
MSTDIMYDFYFPTISSLMLFILSIISIVVFAIEKQKTKKQTIPLPYYKKSGGRNNPRKPIKFSPNITNTFWYPVILGISISIFMYSLGIIRKINMTPGLVFPYKYASYVIFGGTLSLIVGFILMLNYIELACSVWEFNHIISILFAWTVTNFILTTNLQAVGGIKIYILIMVSFILALNVLMAVITNMFYHYIK